MSESAIRLSVFVGALILLALLEAGFPRRARRDARLRRWRTNLALSVINTLALRLLGPVIAVSAASWAATEGIGLLNNVTLPAVLALFFSVIVFDLALYGQHVATHRIPLLWRLHRVHHTDQDLDVTSGLRFHPVEILLSMTYKCGVVLVLGPSVMAVVIYEITLNAAAMFNHANLALPKWLDRTLRPVLVTPDMHRVHHSVHMDETNSNYGNFLSFWDKLFRTYRAHPRDGHDEMRLGLAEWQGDEPGRLLWSLANPVHTPKDI